MLIPSPLFEDIQAYIEKTILFNFHEQRHIKCTYHSEMKPLIFNQNILIILKKQPFPQHINLK